MLDDISTEDEVIFTLYFVVPLSHRLEMPLYLENVMLSNLIIEGMWSAVISSRPTMTVISSLIQSIYEQNYKPDIDVEEVRRLMVI